jgi:hypothetical protein
LPQSLSCNGHFNLLHQLTLLLVAPISSQACCTLTVCCTSCPLHQPLPILVPPISLHRLPVAPTHYPSFVPPFLLHQLSVAPATTYPCPSHFVAPAACCTYHYLSLSLHSVALALPILCPSLFVAPAACCTYYYLSFVPPILLHLLFVAPTTAHLCPSHSVALAVCCTYHCPSLSFTFRCTYHYLSFVPPIPLHQLFVAPTTAHLCPLHSIAPTTTHPLSLPFRYTSCLLHLPLPIL